jgi:DNA polymerase V
MMASPDELPNQTAPCEQHAGKTHEEVEIVAPSGVTCIAGYQLLGCLVGTVKAGFPSPAEDHAGKHIDLFERLNTHPQATYFMRVSGLSMMDAGISEGDVIVVDRAIKPKSGQIVVAVIDGEFTVKQLSMRAGVVKLKAANPTFKDIVLREGQDLVVWGVVKAALKEFKT